MLAPGTASAAQFEVFIDIETEQDLYELLFTDQISLSSFDALLLLHQTRVDLNRASRQDLYSLPNLNYAQVDRILAYRNGAGSIHSLDELIGADALTPKLARSIRAFIIVGDPSAVRSLTKALLRLRARWTGRHDRLPPAFALQARVRTLGNLDMGVAAALTRNGLRRVRWDSNRNALSAEAERVQFEVPKLYVEWDDKRWELVAGTYRIGFGQRLTFDVTDQVTPNGSFGDFELRAGSDLGLRCNRSPGELPQSPCSNGPGVRVTPDYQWTNRLAGVALGLKELRLGQGWLQAYAWGSYQVHRIAQIELVDAAACDNPHRDQAPGCLAPPVFVRGRDPRAPASTTRLATLPAMYAEGLAGANASYFWNDRAHLGITGYGSVPRWLVEGTDLGFQEFSRKPFGGPFGAIGLDAAFGFGQQDFFVELARSFDSQREGGGGYAALVRGVTTLPKGELDLSLRYYGSRYANPYARPVSAPDELDGLRARDEAGARFRATAKLGPQVVLRTLLDGSRRLSTGVLNALLFARTDWRITSRWTWAIWGEYRNGSAQRFVVATQLAYAPVRRVSLSGQARYRWAGKLGSDRLQQDLSAILKVTGRPVDRLRVRCRLRYDFEDIWDNHRLPQSLWHYLDVALTLRDRDVLQLRYDFRVFLDERESTLSRVPNPEHWLWVEYIFRF
ncbi:MAG: helix-hairpin-helix domain-containing protein [Myxococcales bacterium]|nr:helix-hairpin-helix domain-containing protein [Deltaproteobacteria bacterium]NNE19426.1 helix-hairpin-helix domain-containing protein [Myxococcales bacterium]